jgi:hypothetical protein
MVAKRESKRWKTAASLGVLVAILLVGGYLRFKNLNWDEGTWIHPDEAHMQQTLAVVKMPDSFSLYFDTHNSPLNVRNSGQKYSYGTLPLFLTRMTAEWVNRACDTPPDKLSRTVASLLIGFKIAGCSSGTFTATYSALVGRAFSALADLGTLCLIYLIGRHLYDRATGLLAAGLWALTVLSIQQAHFFTVDSMACFFTTLVVYFSVRASQTGSWLDFGLAGLATGLAAACKINAALASFLVVLAAISHVVHHTSPLRVTHHASRSLFLRLCLAGLLSLVAFRIAQPYAFEGPGFFGVWLSPGWLNRLYQIRIVQSGVLDMPSEQQWAHRAPILFSWSNMVIWGMGLPLGLAAWSGWAVTGVELFRGKRVHLILWGWATLMFLYMSCRWVKSMRYILFLYPMFILLAAYLLIRLCRASSHWRRRVGFAVTALVVVGTLFWAGAFFSIYLRSHTRLAASRWIYANIPPGATLAQEHWDWSPPLKMDGYDPSERYNEIEMQLYDDDNSSKLAQLYYLLDLADYIIIGSNRLYASIPRLPTRHPLTTEYYRALFAGELGFDLAADFTSFPALGPFQFPDQENPFPLMEADYAYRQNAPLELHLPPAEEPFSVYDHPRVLIFRKTEDYAFRRVVEILGNIDTRDAQHGLRPIDVSVTLNLLEIGAILVGVLALFGLCAHARTIRSRLSARWRKP